MAAELITEEELLGVVRKQGFEDFADVETCVLEPNGSFYISGKQPSSGDKQHAELLARLDALQAEVRALQAGPRG
jgi:uncharacterized membrane protein YcaP (DUF421 family)